MPLRQALRFVCIKRVVDSYGVASLFKNQVQCRAGPRSVIQPVTFFREKSDKRAKKLTEETAAVWTLGLVFVLVIAGLFRRRRYLLFRFGEIELGHHAAIVGVHLLML